MSPTRPTGVTRPRKPRPGALPVNPDDLGVAPSEVSAASAESTRARARQARWIQGKTEDSMRVARWMLDHPASTQQQAADALGLPRYQVGLLMPMARTSFDGYLIPPAKPGRERFTDAEMFAALRSCAKQLGLRKGESLSKAQYAAWRAGFPATSRTPKEPSQATLPSHLAYRRRYGTWNKAITLAGMTANDLPRLYDRLEEEDILLWIAVWLRHLTQAGQGLVDATQRQYRMWARSNPQAPCEEILTMHGKWASLLATAAALEKSTKKLPKPKPVGTGGRIKNPR